YIADFYNRIIGHYEVRLDHPGRDRYRGRIWRIVYRGPNGKIQAIKPRPDWSKAAITELVADLASPNLTVRFKAANQLVERGGDEAVREVKKLFGAASNPHARMHGLWVLDRLGRLERGLLTGAARDADLGVRVHAMKVLSERARLEGELRELVLAG